MFIKKVVGLAHHFHNKISQGQPVLSHQLTENVILPWFQLSMTSLQAFTAVAERDNIYPKVWICHLHLLYF